MKRINEAKETKREKKKVPSENWFTSTNYLKRSIERQIDHERFQHDRIKSQFRDVLYEYMHRIKEIERSEEMFHKRLFKKVLTEYMKRIKEANEVKEANEANEAKELLGDVFEDLINVQNEDLFEVI
jgi:uncharacterized protein with von Willebrand factor type A (vWA) domain